MFVAIIPARSWWVNLPTGVAGGLAALFAGVYWLQDTTDGKAGWYIGAAVIASILMSVSLAIGPGVSVATSRLFGKRESGEK